MIAEHGGSVCVTPIYWRRRKTGARASIQLESEPRRKYSVTASTARGCSEGFGWGEADSGGTIGVPPAAREISGNLRMLLAEMTNAAAVGSPARASPKIMSLSKGPISRPPRRRFSDCSSVPAEAKTARTTPFAVANKATAAPAVRQRRSRPSRAIAGREGLQASSLRAPQQLRLKHPRRQRGIPVA